MYVKKIFSFVGRNTMIILALHAPVIRLLNVIFVKFFEFPSEHMNELISPNYVPGLWLVYATLGICVPLIYPYIRMQKERKND